MLQRLSGVGEGRDEGDISLKHLKCELEAPRSEGRGEGCEHWVLGAAQAWIEQLGSKHLLVNLELGEGSPVIGQNVDLIPFWK